MRFRDGGLITHPEDYQDEPQPRKKYSYYWWFDFCRILC
jgi:hypothetical protein